MNFTTDSKTTKLFETYSQIVSQDYLPNQNLMGHQTLVAEVGHNVTKKILGVPYEPTDLNTINIDVEKNNNKIKVVHKENLVKEEVQKINQFRLNFRIDFSETAIRIHYVTFMDVFSDLGGLNASVNSILG